MKLLNLKSRVRPRMVTNLGGHARMFGTVYEPIDDDDDRVVEVAGAIKAVPVSQAQEASVQAEQLAEVSVADIARHNGWGELDLAGTGAKGRPGPLGGVSPVTGLCLADMALCVPPDGWDEQRDETYPWELKGWKAPGLDWTVPKVPSKAEEEDEVEEYDDDPDPDDDVDIDDDDDDTDDELDEDTDAAEQVEEDPDGYVNEEVLENYGTPDEIVRAREVLRELIDLHGEPPSRQRANYYLTRKADPRLPSVGVEELEALLAPFTA